MTSSTTTNLIESQPPEPVGAARPPAARSMAVSSRWLGWLALAAVAASPLAEAVRILVQRPRVVLYGDQALMDLGARRAVQLDELVGPYSRNGFHHPGPAVFYLLAPFVRLLEPSDAGLYLGAVAINAAALVATVAVMWRRAGPLAALASAVAIDLYCICLGVGTLREPWNPYLVIAPMVLFVVLWAAACSGSGAAGLWALVVGSYEIQTHVATAPVVVVMSGVLGVVTVQRGRVPRMTIRGRLRFATWSAGVALTVIWVPPLIELFRDRPNNLQLVWDYFAAGHGGPSLRQGLRAAAEAMTIMPFGNQDYVLSLARNPAELACAGLAAAAVVVVALREGHRRHERLTVTLVAGALIAAVVGTASLVLTPGPVYLYFAVWLSCVPLALLMALAVGLLGRQAPARQGRVPRSTTGPVAYRAATAAVALCVASALVTGADALVSDLSMGTIAATKGSGPWPSDEAGTAQGREQTIQDTAALSMAAEGVLRPGDRTVGFTIGSASLWPYVAGMVVQLDEAGVQATVGPAGWELYFGRERAPGRPVDVQFDVYSISGPGPASPHPAVLADIDGTVLAYRRVSG